MPKKFLRGNNAQLRAADHLDDLAEFQKFREDVLPVLRRALSEGLSAEQIYKKFESIAAARAVSIAALEVDSAKALAAIKDVLDRTGGKAKERSEITHRMANAPEEQVDAIILAKLKAAAEADEEADDTTATH